MVRKHVYECVDRGNTFTLRKVVGRKDYILEKRGDVGQLIFRTLCPSKEAAKKTANIRRYEYRRGPDAWVKDQNL